VNQFYAIVATADDYNQAEIISLREVLTPDDYNLVDSFSFNEMDIEPLLRKLKNTAPGYDHLPRWVYKTCSYELAGIIAFLINYSFAQVQFQPLG
jgi:hypothetical protein